MARYTDDSRERVRDAVDFAELVGARTELRVAGQRRLSGLCPFHDERTPSFGIDPVEKVYHCFGCGAGGDLFKFVMETEGLDFVAALESLADRFGVQLEREAEDPRTAERRARRDRLLALLERTAAFYVRVLWESREAQRAREYLDGRGLSEGVLREFRVGYAPSAWDKVLTASRAAGYSAEELLDTGLATRGRGGGLLDRFRGRIMFPLADERGRVLGFGARAMRDAQGPKYLNSAEGELFHKGRQLYGVDIARAAAAREGRVVLVEGYTDVLALHQAGIRGTVGTMGTALTAEQAQTLTKLAPRALLCLDADSSGMEAMLRGIDVVQKVERVGRALDLRIVSLPSGLDPADFVAREGADAMTAALERSVDLARFRVERALERGDLTNAEGRDRVVEELRPVFAALGDGLLYQELVRLTANRLDTTPELLARLLSSRGAPRAGRFDRPGAPAGPQFTDGRSAPTNGGPAAEPWQRFEETERAFLARCLAVPDAGREAMAAVDVERLFTSALTRRGAAHLREHFDHPGEGLPVDDAPLAHLIAELVIRAGDLEGDPGALALERLTLEKLRLDRDIHAAERAGEPVGELARERQRVQDEIRHLLV
jgi:DNA primase